jgi:AcrR family transcriptional regulator
MPRAYRPRHRSTRAEETRRRIVAAARELLEEGAFHEARVEEVAGRAGVSRATLYGHFHSRLDLVDALCDTFAGNPALRERAGAGDLDGAIAASVRLWSSDGAALAQLYGVAAIDGAARELAERQRAERRADMERLVRELRRGGELRADLTERRALSLLMVLTSYEAFRELREAGVAERDVSRTLQESARALLFAPWT